MNNVISGPSSVSPTCIPSGGLFKLVWALLGPDYWCIYEMM